MEETFDIELIGKAFLHGALQDQDELLRRLNNPFRDSKAVRDLVSEVLEAAFKAHATPVQIIGLGLAYGMAAGIFIERERHGRKEHSFDVNGVVKGFLSGAYPRTKIMNALTAAFSESEIVKNLQIAVGQEVVRNSNSPIQAIAISLRYGMAMGITLEIDRRVREREKVVVQ
jgi:hypothetical protein